MTISPTSTLVPPLLIPRQDPPPDCTPIIASLQASAASKIAEASTSLQLLLESNIEARKTLSSANAAISLAQVSASDANIAIASVKASALNIVISGNASLASASNAVISEKAIAIAASNAAVSVASVLQVVQSKASVAIEVANARAQAPPSTITVSGNPATIFSSMTVTVLISTSESVPVPTVITELSTQYSLPTITTTALISESRSGLLSAAMAETSTLPTLMPVLASSAIPITPITVTLFAFVGVFFLSFILLLIYHIRYRTKMARLLKSNDSATLLCRNSEISSGDGKSFVPYSVYPQEAQRNSTSSIKTNLELTVAEVRDGGDTSQEGDHHFRSSSSRSVSVPKSRRTSELYFINRDQFMPVRLPKAHPDSFSSPLEKNPPAGKEDVVLGELGVENSRESRVVLGEGIQRESRAIGAAM